MQKEWSSFRITLLLYIAVLLLPFSFYFVYTSFETMQQDTKIVRKTSWLAGAIGKNDAKTVQNIDKSLQDIALWTDNNNDTSLYIGANTLSEDFEKVRTCWTNNKKDLAVVSSKCYTLSKSMALNIEKMVYLRQDKIINMFYISLTFGMIFILLIIYLIRTYIRIQMQKNAIIDVETTLFNKKYFLSSLKSMYARAVRHQYPLSTLKVELEGFEEGGVHYDSKNKADTLMAFGTLLHSLVRDGDLPARYDENHFIILLPFTNEDNAHHFEKRIREALMQDDCMISENIKMNFTIKELDKEESSEAFLHRTITS